MIKKIINIIKSIYDVFIYKIIKYYDPIIEKSIYTLPINNNNNNNNNRLSKYNIFKLYSNVKYIYKLQNIEYSNQIYYNLGIIYHTSDLNINLISDRELVYFEDDVDHIRIKLLNNLNNEYIIIDEKFVNSILNFATNRSRLEPLLYYYLNKYLSNHDRIIEVELCIDNSYIKVDINNKLEDLLK